MMKMNLQLFAHKKGVGSTKNGRDSDRRRRYARRHLCAQRMHRYGCGYVRSGD